MRRCRTILAGSIEAAGGSRLSILRLNHAQATDYVSENLIVTALDNRGNEHPIAPPANLIRVALDLAPDRRELRRAKRATRNRDDAAQICAKVQSMPLWKGRDRA